MEDQSQYSKREKIDGKTELFRVYYDPSQISFDLFLWIEQKVVIDSILAGLKTFKAYPSEIGILQICKN